MIKPDDVIGVGVASDLFARPIQLAYTFVYVVKMFLRFGMSDTGFKLLKTSNWAPKPRPKFTPALVLELLQTSP